MRKWLCAVLVVLLALAPVTSFSESLGIDLGSMTLEELQTLDQEVHEAIAKAMPEQDETASAPVESILTIDKVKISEKYSAINVEVTVKNTSKDQVVDAYSLIAYGFDAYGEPVKYMMTSESVPLESTETIKQGKTSPKGYHWSLYNMGTLKTLKVAIARYHIKDGDAVEIPEDQYIFVEGEKK